LAPGKLSERGGKEEKIAFPEPGIEAFGSWEALRKRRKRGGKSTFRIPESRHLAPGKVSEVIHFTKIP